MGWDDIIHLFWFGFWFIVFGLCVPVFCERREYRIGFGLCALIASCGVSLYAKTDCDAVILVCGLIIFRLIFI